MTHEIFTVSLDELRTRTSMKWRRYGPDVLPLWVAEMDCHVAAPVARRLHEVIDAGDTGYPAGPVYEEAVARFASDTWGLEVSADHMALMPDVMGGLRLAVQQVTSPGDAIVINPPVYAPFFATVKGTGRELLEVPMRADGRLDLPAMEAAFAGERGPRPAAFLLSSPHNPTGVPHRSEELAQVAMMARRHGVRVIVDAIHAPLTDPGVDYVPYLSVPGSEDALVVFSASKAWNLAGLKAAVMVAGTEARTDLEAIPYDAARGAASHLGVIAHQTALDNGRDWLAQLRREIADNRGLLERLVGEQLPGVRVLAAQATYLAWLDCRELGLADPAAHFLQEAGVALNPGPSFGTGGAGHVRLNLATSPQILTEAITRMAASLG